MQHLLLVAANTVSTTNPQKVTKPDVLSLKPTDFLSRGAGPKVLEVKSDFKNMASG